MSLNSDSLAMLFVNIQLPGYVKLFST